MWAERRAMPDPEAKVSQCQFSGAVVNSLGLYFPHPCNGRSLSWDDWEGSLNHRLFHRRSSHKPGVMCWRCRKHGSTRLAPKSTMTGSQTLSIVRPRGREGGERGGVGAQYWKGSLLRNRGVHS